jgi:hypothetical protein
VYVTSITTKYSHCTSLNFTVLFICLYIIEILKIEEQMVLQIKLLL